MNFQLPSDSRVFLTGGTGFFGKWLLRTVSEQNESSSSGISVVVLSRNPEKFLQNYARYGSMPWLSFVKGDIVNFVFPSGDFSHVIHAATDTNAAAIDDPVGWFDQIVQGSRRVLDFAIASNAKKFLLTSSGAVYGPQPADLSHIPETYGGAPDPSDILSLYGQAKRAAEQLCAIYHHSHGLQTTIARCFAFVGEHLPLSGHFAIGNFIKDALEADSIRIRGDGSSFRSYLYGADLGHWLLTILEHGQPGHPYNVGSDQAISMIELAHLVANVLSPGKPVIVENTMVDAHNRSRYVPDIGRAKNELALGVVTPLDVAILNSVSNRWGSA